MASGTNNRTRGPLLPCPRPRPPRAINSLSQARDHYAAWGATAKVAQLDWAYPTPRPAPDSTREESAGPPGTRDPRRPGVTTGTLDLLGILSASQVLSSETGLEELQARVVEVLGALTGATAVHLSLWDDGSPGLAADSTRQHRPGRNRPRIRGTAVGAARHPAHRRAADRGRRHRGRPVRPRPLSRRRRLLCAAGGTHFRPWHRACGAAAGKPIAARSVHGRATRRGHAYRQSACRLTRERAAVRAAGRLPQARIVTAGDAARRRIERDLHDGAQQRLVTLAARAARPEIRGAAGRRTGYESVSMPWPPTSPAPWKSSARPPAACTLRCLPAVAYLVRYPPSPGVPPFRSSWTCGLDERLPERSNWPATTRSPRH